MTCADIEREHATITAEERKIETTIASSRGENQAKVFILGAAGAAFANYGIAERNRMGELQAQRDRLIIVARQKSC